MVPTNHEMVVTFVWVVLTSSLGEPLTGLSTLTQYEWCQFCYSVYSKDQAHPVLIALTGVPCFRDCYNPDGGDRTQNVDSTTLPDGTAGNVGLRCDRVESPCEAPLENVEVQKRPTNCRCVLEQGTRFWAYDWETVDESAVRRVDVVGDRFSFMLSILQAVPIPKPSTPGWWCGLSFTNPCNQPPSPPASGGVTLQTSFLRSRICLFYAIKLSRSQVAALIESDRDAALEHGAKAPGFCYSIYEAYLTNPIPNKDIEATDAKGSSTSAWVPASRFSPSKEDFEELELLCSEPPPCPTPSSTSGVSTQGAGTSPVGGLAATSTLSAPAAGSTTGSKGGRLPGGVSIQRRRMAQEASFEQPEECRCVDGFWHFVWSTPVELRSEMSAAGPTTQGLLPFNPDLLSLGSVTIFDLEREVSNAILGARDRLPSSASIDGDDLNEDASTSDECERLFKQNGHHSPVCLAVTFWVRAEIKLANAREATERVVDSTVGGDLDERFKVLIRKTLMAAGVDNPPVARNIDADDFEPPDWWVFLSENFRPGVARFGKTFAERVRYRLGQIGDSIDHAMEKHINQVRQRNEKFHPPEEGNQEPRLMDGLTNTPDCKTITCTEYIGRRRLSAEAAQPPTEVMALSTWWDAEHAHEQPGGRLFRLRPSATGDGVELLVLGPDNPLLIARALDEQLRREPVLNGSQTTTTTTVAVGPVYDTTITQAAGMPSDAQTTGVPTWIVAVVVGECLALIAAVVAFGIAWRWDRAAQAWAHHQPGSGWQYG